MSLLFLVGADNHETIQTMENIENTEQTLNGKREKHDEYQYINLIEEIIKKGI